MKISRIFKYFKRDKTTQPMISDQLKVIQSEIDEEPRIFLLPVQPLIENVCIVDNIKYSNLEELILGILILCDKKVVYTKDSDFKSTSPTGRRSVGALYRLAKEYKEDVTLEQVYETLRRLISSKKIGSFICADIRKRVYFVTKEAWKLRSTFGSDDIDEYNFKYGFEPGYVGYGTCNGVNELTMHKTTIRWHSE